MNFFEIAAILVCLAAGFGVLNQFSLRLPNTIGLVVIGLVASLILIGLDAVIPGFSLDDRVRKELFGIDFADTLLEGMLGFLLFAGALHVDFDALRKEKWAVASMATIGVLTSAALVATGFHFLAGVPFIIALVFGALISPTDPVAVLGLLKRIKVPHSLETKIAAESLFNDGVAYVLFLIVTALAFGGHESTLGAVDVARLFVVEVGGGAVLGGVAGWLVFQAMRRMDDYALEVLLTLALVMGTYALAIRLHVSGPIAVVVAGLLIGHSGVRYGMSENTREHVEAFWRMIDEILNAVLFLLVGLEVLAVAFHTEDIILGLVCIPLVIAARFLAVGLPVTVLRLRRTFTTGAIPMLTWGGLRGGISVALVLSLPDESEYKPLLLTVTYVIVIFSIIVQGLTMENVIRYFLARKNPEPE
ncbi:cation:proton antiporter [Minwuia thermotolerans]|uniref:Sodium:proton antiporter n=1 Tax=Minwuia thermotolerans TaxID=2056226 RepID=A0A2M9G3P8_9PROT|nr:sodium:proton antiporter [Minwuia thermotolerans]PJK30306.1 sodium:proton antiporter [Minwuia thermotolerans]